MAVGWSEVYPLVPAPGAGQQLAVPTYAFRVDVGGVQTTVRAYNQGPTWTIPVSVATPTGGFVQLVAVMDAGTFGWMVEQIERFGLVPRVSDLVERYFGHKPMGRPCLPR